MPARLSTYSSAISPDEAHGTVTRRKKGWLPKERRGGPDAWDKTMVRQALAVQSLLGMAGTDPNFEAPMLEPRASRPGCLLPFLPLGGPGLARLGDGRVQSDGTDFLIPPGPSPQAAVQRAPVRGARRGGGG